MTAPDRIIALAERVEGLTKADRETACAIAKAIGWRPEDGAPGSTTSAPWAWCPDFTASLDAIVAMFPANMTGWSLNVDGDYCQAALYRNGDGVIGRGDASDPRFALLAATLRAHASMKDTDNEQ